VVKRRILAIAIVAASLIVIAKPARATHEAGASGNAAQNLSANGATISCSAIDR